MNLSCYNNILVAAMLHQPIILRGHHHDISDGLKLLASLSKYINSLGIVRWTDMKRVSRGHYSKKYAGATLHIRMFTKRIEIFVPDEINQLLVERSWVKGVNFEPLAWRSIGEELDWTLLRPGEPIPVIPGKVIEIISSLPPPFNKDIKTFRRFHIWPVVRRNITEARDRIAPLRKLVRVSRGH